jgi:hypothetical protein
MSNTEIVQYNCGNSNAHASRALFDSFTRPIALAIQEPGWNRYTKSTYCPKTYQLAYEATPETKVCFMVRRDVSVSQWKRTQFGPNVARLDLQLQGRVLSIVNVYNPPRNRTRISVWPEIQQAADEAPGQILLLGDFNAHHLRWGGAGTVCEQHAEHLLQATQARELLLLTEQGDTTWRRGSRSSVIDLVFAEPAISRRVVYCGAKPEWALTRDHIPIQTLIDITSIAPQATSARFAIEKLDIDAAKAEIEAIGVAQTLEGLQTQIRGTLERVCPRARPSTWARPDWSPKAAELLAGSRRARRRYTARGTQEDL